MVPAFAHNIGVRNFVAAVDGGIFVSDDPECVSSPQRVFWGGLYIPYICLVTDIPVCLNMIDSTFSCIWGGIVVEDVTAFFM